MPPGSTPLWGPGGVPGEWSDVCGFLKPPSQSRQAGNQGNRSVLPSLSVDPLPPRLMLGWLIVHHETTNVAHQVRERGTHLTTTARKGGSIGETRPFPSVVRVTHVTTHGFRKPPALYVSKNAALFHQDVRGVNPETMSGHLLAVVFFCFSKKKTVILMAPPCHSLHVALHLGLGPPPCEPPPFRFSTLGLSRTGLKKG